MISYNLDGTIETSFDRTSVNLVAIDFDIYYNESEMSELDCDSTTAPNTDPDAPDYF